MGHRRLGVLRGRLPGLAGGRRLCRSRGSSPLHHGQQRLLRAGRRAAVGLRAAGGRGRVRGLQPRPGAGGAGQRRGQRGRADVPHRGGAGEAPRRVRRVQPGRHCDRHHRRQLPRAGRPACERPGLEVPAGADRAAGRAAVPDGAADVAVASVVAWPRRGGGGAQGARGAARRRLRGGGGRRAGVAEEGQRRVRAGGGGGHERAQPRRRRRQHAGRGEAEQELACRAGRLEHQDAAHPHVRAARRAAVQRHQRHDPVLDVLLQGRRAGEPGRRYAARRRRQRRSHGRLGVPHRAQGPPLPHPPLRLRHAARLRLRHGRTAHGRRRRQRCAAHGVARRRSRLRGLLCRGPRADAVAHRRRDLPRGVARHRDGHGRQRQLDVHLHHYGRLP
mmetsp:Transcript_27942/g.96580  ORF Transcript_27942/g.96580 Transcript_27942/m.96580 type:complete len:389 (-) Transcript_27942:243-1409(-)